MIIVNCTVFLFLSIIIFNRQTIHVKKQQLVFSSGPDLTGSCFPIKLMELAMANGFNFVLFNQITEEDSVTVGQ